ncbi:MAG: tRNA (adenosine(37)-N6)-dimethylallyltransferase MiaA [Bacteroidales bacterium]
MIDLHKKPTLVVITGPTASGKTRLAALVADRLDSEVISADSRQVYRGMNLATGKDFDDYRVGNRQVPFHLVDIAEPGYHYNLFEFKRDFYRIYHKLRADDKIPVLCGGTGLYIEAIIRKYDLPQVPENPAFREEVADLPDEVLIERLKKIRPLHNKTDIETRERLLRAIEIAEYTNAHPDERHDPELRPAVFVVRYERAESRQRITQRLYQRLEAGMVNEVKELLQRGLTPRQLDYYGLEYRYLTRYVTGELSYDEMVRKLNTAIHQFAKRQMTWFRGMERRGVEVQWIAGELPIDQKVELVLKGVGVV